MDPAIICTCECSVLENQHFARCNNTGICSGCFEFFVLGSQRQPKDSQNWMPLRSARANGRCLKNQHFSYAACCNSTYVYFVFFQFDIFTSSAFNDSPCAQSVTSEHRKCMCTRGFRILKGCVPYSQWMTTARDCNCCVLSQQ